MRFVVVLHNRRGPDVLRGPSCSGGGGWGRGRQLHFGVVRAATANAPSARQHRSCSGGRCCSACRIGLLLCAALPDTCIPQHPTGCHIRSSSRSSRSTRFAGLHACGCVRVPQRFRRRHRHRHPQRCLYLVVKPLGADGHRADLVPATTSSLTEGAAVCLGARGGGMGRRPAEEYERSGPKRRQSKRMPRHTTPAAPALAALGGLLCALPVLGCRSRAGEHARQWVGDQGLRLLRLDGSRGCGAAQAFLPFSLVGPT